VTDDLGDGRERRLLQIREEALRTGRVDAEAIAPGGAPLPVSAAGAKGYYGLPLLKPPVWTWEIPAYLFIGGAAGAAAVIGAVARRMDGNRSLIADARWVAAAGAAAAVPLLISDLGRPERFLNMLRVFKLRSPMSVGAWTLLAFSTAAGAAAFAETLDQATTGWLPVTIVGNAAETVSAVTGLVLTTYTGVLLGATAVPVWSRNVHLLPIQFGASGVATAASILELLGHRHRALKRIAVGAAVVESASGLLLESRPDPSIDPLTTGRTGLVTALGTVLSGPVPLALRILGRRSPTARRAAALSTIAGSLLTRIAWIQAGRQSALSPAQTAAASGDRHQRTGN
jgi:hypothetical protein